MCLNEKIFRKLKVTTVICTTEFLFLSGRPGGLSACSPPREKRVWATAAIPGAYCILLTLGYIH
jgi:hypothetical protein